MVKKTVRLNYGDERSLSQRYDGFGRLTGELSGEGSAALAALGTGASQAQIDAIYNSYGTTYTYDAGGRLATRTVADGKGSSNRTVYFYNLYGVVLEVNALGEAIEYKYDLDGRRTDTIVHGKRLDVASGYQSWN